MGNDAKKTEGGTYIRVDTDKRGKDHIDIYDQDPKGPHDESIHITIKEDGSGTITTKSGDEPRETTDTKCYLTSACMKYFQEKFDDNCYELAVLRWFRDNFVSKEDIEHYYDLYDSFFKQENLPIEYAARYSYGGTPSKDCEYKILHIGQHIRSKEDLALVEMCNDERLRDSIYIVKLNTLKKK